METGRDRAAHGARIRVEQALAYGHSRAWICEHVGVTPDYIDEVIERQNAACTQDVGVAGVMT